MGALEHAHAVPRAENRASHRLVGESRLLHQVEHDVLRRIHRRGDLLEDHVALARQLGAVKARADDDVAQNIEREREVLAQHARVIGGRVDPGRGVELAADRLDLLGDVASAPPRGALEGHMLQEMRDAMLALRFASAAGPDPDAE